MSHHLRGTSDALAENVFITGRKGHGNYGRWPWVSTVQKRSGPASDSPVLLHWHLRRFFEIMKPSVSFLALIFVLFSPFLLAADRDPSPGDSDKVSGRAIIHEMNTARQNPKLYAIFLEQTRQNYPGRGRLCARDGVRTVDEAIRFLRCTRPVP